MFVPAVVLVLDGNLSVQTALVRFAAALLVSWAAARLVWATVRSARRRPGREPVTSAGVATAPERAASAAAPAGRDDRGRRVGTRRARDVRDGSRPPGMP